MALKTTRKAKRTIDECLEAETGFVYSPRPNASSPAVASPSGRNLRRRLFNEGSPQVSLRQHVGETLVDLELTLVNMTEKLFVNTAATIKYLQLVGVFATQPICECQGPMQLNPHNCLDG